MSLKLRRGTNAERLTITPDIGELIYTTDTKRLYAGDGVTVGGNLVSYEGSVQGSLGGDLILGGNNITGTGNININGTIDSGNINVNGSITASGTITANGNIILGNADTDNVTIGADVNSNIIPNFGNTYDLGSDTKAWRNVYADFIFGEIEGSVRAQDSTLLVDSVEGVLRGQLLGSVSNPGQVAVSGNVNGNVTGDVTGSVKSGNGTVVLDNGTDGTDAVFTGNVIGNLTGTVTNGVLTTGSYTDPGWIASLNANRLFGTMSGVYVDGDVTGSVFANDSTMLVDGHYGVLRGLHLGTIDTGDILIERNLITGPTNGNLILEAQGTGTISLQASTKVENLTVVNPFTVFTENANAQSITTYSAFDNAIFDGSSISIARARGTTTSPTALQLGDLVGVISFSGLTGGTTYESAAIISVDVADTVSSGIMPGNLSISVTDSTGNSNIVLTVQGDKVVRFNSPELIAGVGSGQVDTSSVATYMKVNIGGVEYAIPAYAINP